MSEEQANIKVMRGKLAELHEAYEKLVAAYVANPPPHWLLPRDPMDEPVPQCCANCEQGENQRDDDGKIDRVKCTPFLTFWLHRQLDHMDLAEVGIDLLSQFTAPTDGAGCDCFIPRGGDR